MTKDQFDYIWHAYISHMWEVKPEDRHKYMSRLGYLEDQEFLIDACKILKESRKHKDTLPTTGAFVSAYNYVKE